MNKNKKWIFSSIILLGFCTLFYCLFFTKKRVPCKHIAQTIHPYFFPIPITCDGRNPPVIPIRLGDQTFSLELDLGLSGEVVLPSQILNAIPEKTYLSIGECRGFRGKTYEEKEYNIPTAEISPVTFRDILASEESKEFRKDARVCNTSSAESFPSLSNGRIGWSLFKNTNLFLDLGNSQIAFCDSLDSLKKEGYPIDTFVKFPLVLENNLLEFTMGSMNENQGPLHFVLDTGATLNLANASLKDEEEEASFYKPDWKPSYGTLNIKINEADFAALPVYAIPIHLTCPIDIVLGMPFFKEHFVFHDFQENCVYFAKHPDHKKMVTVLDEAVGLGDGGELKYYGSIPLPEPILDSRVAYSVSVKETHDQLQTIRSFQDEMRYFPRKDLKNPVEGKIGAGFGISWGGAGDVEVTSSLNGSVQDHRGKRVDFDFKYN